MKNPNKLSLLVAHLQGLRRSNETKRLLVLLLHAFRVNLSAQTSSIEKCCEEEKYGEEYWKSIVKKKE